ncbi:LysR substrate-binding domain-containing protein [Magnetospirillum sp. 64-120]|uniref:LysR family transcriptional regulator n=1 Tax=Magnetospirillum sp. 64-120 TaxID=1895778 RepID=UPI000AE9075D|nr:LysR substrate-binding domain-containing protein [Magnetospirillum sp. 64-120]
MIELRPLRYFLSIVEHRSLSRAAEVLHVAQPALSLHLKRLEAQFGCQLVHRTTRGVVPTESGQRLAQQARALLEKTANLVDEVRGFEATPSGPAMIGIPTSVGTILTVPLVKRVREKFPDIRLKVLEALSGHMREWVLSGEVDMAIIFGAEPPPGLTTHFLARESLCLVGPHDDPALSGDTTIEMDQVLDLPLIMPSRPHGVREEVERAATIRRRPPNVIVELDALPQIKALVADGIGYTILSQRYARHGSMAERLSITPITRPAIERVISLAHASDRPLSVAAGAVQAQLLHLVTQLTHDGRWI